MIRQFFKLAVRNFFRTKAYSIINIVGLSLGLAIAILLFEWMKFENSYDRFHVNRQRIFRVITGRISAEDCWRGTPAQLGPILQDHIPEIEEFVRLDKRFGLVKANGKVFHEENIFLADSSFFKVFSFPMLEGNAENAFSNPESVVITREMAEKYFGDQDPLGEYISIDERNYIITGITKDVPENSHFHFDFLIRFDLFHGANDAWGNFNYSTYLLTKENTDREALEKKIRGLKVLNGTDKINMDFVTLQPVSRIHYEYIRGNFEPEFSRQYLLGYSSVILVILILACVNYINLSVAIAPLRFKEVGIKKTLGAGRSQLRLQFLGESVLSSLAATLLAVILSELFLPSFNRMIGKNLAITFFTPDTILLLTGFSLILGLIIGIYPAIISENVPVLKIMNGSGISLRRSGLRNILVFVQLAISIGFIICTLLFNKQMHFIRNTDLGFNKDRIMNVRFYPSNIKSMEDIVRYRQSCIQFKDEALKYDKVLSASINAFQPATLNRNHVIDYPGRNKDDQLSMFVIAADKDFAKTFNIKILAGEDKIMNFVMSGTEGYILNESAVKALGWQEPLDRSFTIYHNGRYGRIIGVCSDFNYRSLHHAIGPCVIVLGEPGMTISLKLSGDGMPQTIEWIRKKYKSMFREVPFDYSFFEQDFDKMYKSEIKIAGTTEIVSILSMIIACLGLYGLTSFFTIQRKKEIGVRKVFGSSEFRIVWLFLREIGALVMIALIIMSPVSVYLLRSWLSNYAYKTAISWWIFPLVGLIVLAVSWLSIIYQAFMAARKNPVETLRYQ